MPLRYILQQVAPEEVDLDPSNPRGETPEEIANDASFQQLKNSVYKFGVLVPIVVHKQIGKVKKYRLVDGERRLRAALDTGQKHIPAHIATSKDEMGDLEQAFQIHMLRKQWRPVAQAKGMRRILKAFRKSNPNAREDALLEELQAITGCSDARLKDLRRAARYSDDILNEVDAGHLVFSHLVQFEESFVEQLSQHYGDLLKRLGRKQVRLALLDKARRRILPGARSLMENVVPAILRAKTKPERTYLGELLEQFISERDMTAEEVLRKFERRFPPAASDLLEVAENAIAQAEVLHGLLKQVETGHLLGFPKVAREMKKSLTELKAILNKRLRKLQSIT